MEITEVKFEKLFSLERYNNEKIGLTSSVSKADNPDQVMAELILRVLTIEDCLKLYRQLCETEQYYSNEVARWERQIEQTKSQIAEMKASIDTLAKKIEETGDVDDKLRHACSGRSYKTLQTDLQRYEDELSRAKGQVVKATNAREEMKQRIKVGKFTDKDLDLPKIIHSDQYY